MNTPAQRSALVVPALVFVTVVGIALAFGAVNEIMFVRTHGGRTIELVTGALSNTIDSLATRRTRGRNDPSATNGRDCWIVASGLVADEADRIHQP